jgi:hypothetical protein
MIASLLMNLFFQGDIIFVKSKQPNTLGTANRIIARGCRGRFSTGEAMPTRDLPPMSQCNSPQGEACAQLSTFFFHSFYLYLLCQGEMTEYSQYG